jgi:hypothetical protein
MTDPEPSATTIRGACLCGAVRFEADGPSLFCAHCHCRWCRAAHSAAFVTWLGVREDGFRLVRGADRVRWYTSSEHGRRGFCDTCGTTLLYVSGLSPGEVHLARATVAGPVDREAQGHAFADHAVDWVVLGDDLPRWTSDHPGLEKYRQVPGRE